MDIFTSYASVLFWPALMGATYLGLSTLNLILRPTKITSSLVDPNQRRVITSKITSMTHAVGSMILAYNVINPCLSYEHVENTLEEISLLIFSIGYFLSDILNIIFFDWSVIFFLHHLLAIGYWGTCLFLNQGAFHIAPLIILGEITNPVQIIWDYSRKYKYQALSNILSPIFTYTFIPVRCVLIPIVYSLYLKQIWYIPSIPLQAKIFWIIILQLGQLGNFYWSYLLYKGFKKTR